MNLNIYPVGGINIQRSIQVMLEYILLYIFIGIYSKDKELPTPQNKNRRKKYWWWCWFCYSETVGIQQVTDYVDVTDNCDFQWKLENNQTWILPLVYELYLSITVVDEGKLLFTDVVYQLNEQGMIQ